MANVLDREKLLLALRGYFISENVQPVAAWVQELSQDDASQLSYLRIEGFEPISIPVPQQEIIKLKQRGNRVPGAEGIWCLEGNRIKLQSCPPLRATQFDENLRSRLMKNALLQLGIDPDYYGVTIEPYQLICDSGSRNNIYTHNFQQNPGAFGMLMLQIPVEGGHRGGDLTVRLGLEATELDRSRDNDHLFYLSASFIDCAHEISPVTEGWSLALTYHFVWNEEITPLAIHHGISVPKFFSALKTVKEILCPFHSPTEDCDTELLVIPLLNDYAGIPLSYYYLRGSDQLMVGLLLSTNLLEVRLATAIKYRAGTAYDERRMNTDRDATDEGFPDSPRQLELEQLPLGSSKRFVAEVEEENCWISRFFLVNGEEDSRKNSVPIVWNRDYIFNNIHSVEDLFDDVSPPDKEEYDRYYIPEDDCELKQLWYKPFIIVYPPDSVAIKSRKNFSAVVTDLKKRIATSQMEHKHSDLLQLGKIANHLNRRNPTQKGEAEEEDEEEVDVDIQNLLDICVTLKAKEEGLKIFHYYAQCSNVVWFDFIPQVVAFIGLVGWSACLEFITTIFSQQRPDIKVHLQIDLMWELLREDSEQRNDAAVAVYRQIFATIFNSEDILTIENFVNGVVDGLSLVSYPENVSILFVSIFLLERRNLLDNAEQLIHFVTVFINVNLIPDFSDFLNLFVQDLCNFLLKVDSFQQIREELQQLLFDLCKHFLQQNGPLNDLTFIVCWAKLFVFVDDRLMVQQLTDMIRSFSLYSVTSFELTYELKGILTGAHNLWNDPTLKTVRSQLQRTLNTLPKRSLYQVRRSVSQLKIDCSRLVTPLHLVIAASTSVVNLNQLHKLRESQLNKIIDWYIHNSLDGIELSKEELEENFISFCDLLNVCNNLNQQKKAWYMFNHFLATKSFGSDFLIRPELLSVMAAFQTYMDENYFRKFFNSIRARYIEREEEGWVTFKILLTYHLLQQNNSTCNATATQIFKAFCSSIKFPPDAISVNSVTQCISVINHNYRHVFFLNVLLMENRQLGDVSKYFEPATKYLTQASISELNSFLKALFTDSSLKLLPFSQLKSDVTRKFLTDLCNQGTHIYLSPLTSILATEDLLNWFRLLLYVNDVWHLTFLLDHFCFNSESMDNNSCLRQLLANEDFQTQSRFKSVREHRVLLKLKKRMHKESFVKLFNRQSSAIKKRKLPATVDPSIGDLNPKRARISH